MNTKVALTLTVLGVGLAASFIFNLNAHKKLQTQIDELKTKLD